ncbi:MAG: hypothetical protein JSS56_22110 [Proteobacteria bacterium]|nr:hypothetical protein [Pseudomonadota bacterium]
MTSTMSSRQSRALFRCAAFFNWGAVLILALLAHPLGLQPPQATMFGQLVLVAIFIFGCGFWMVGAAPGANRGIAVIGAWSKMAIVAVVAVHWAAGSATTQLAALVSGDIVFACLFFRFLKRTAR